MSWPDLDLVAVVDILKVVELRNKRFSEKHLNNMNVVDKVFEAKL